MGTIFTIGYEGSNLADFIATLKFIGVRHVLDVRQIAQSRRPGFSKRALATALAEVDIGYSHQRQLGDPKEGREAARAGRIVDFRRIFEAHLALLKTQEALSEAAKTCTIEATALMCFERDPQNCHRALVADRLATLCSLSVRHVGVVADAGECKPFAKAA